MRVTSKSLHLFVIIPLCSRFLKIEMRFCVSLDRHGEERTIKAIRASWDWGTRLAGVACFNAISQAFGRKVKPKRREAADRWRCCYKGIKFGLTCLQLTNLFLVRRLCASALKRFLPWMFLGFIFYEKSIISYKWRSDVWSESLCRDYRDDTL